MRLSISEPLMAADEEVTIRTITPHRDEIALLTLAPQMPEAGAASPSAAPPALAGVVEMEAVSVFGLRGFLLSCVALAGCAGLTPADLEGLLQSTGVLGGAALDEETIVAGLRDALRVGTDRTVRSTSRTNGYFGDSQIRIPLPEQLETIADKLRSVGMAAQLDELELTMNRAAESAAAEATPVFVDAITSMSISDAQSILQGGRRAATDYFEASTRSELAQRFAPIVDTSMQKVGVFQLYDQVAKRIALLPFVDPAQLDLRAFVNDRALDGLFNVLAREEARIREDPAARTTDLLRRVFGS